ncbi:MAG: DUF6763 family protein [Porticoccaceae bacterium]
MAKRVPRVNQWYQDARDDILFEVVAVDNKEQTIEIQYYDGEVGEIEFDAWREMVLLPAQPPEDWRSAYELNDEEDVGGDSRASHCREDPLSTIEPDSFMDMDDYDDNY